MELGTRTRSTTALLTSISAAVRGRHDLQIEEWQGIVEWGEANIADALEGAVTIAEGSYLDTGVPIAGDGAPLVSEFALMELIAVLGRTPDGGRAYVGRVLGCAWRLPETYSQVLAGRVEPWRAERVADLTGSLSFEAAAYVDHQLAIALGYVTWALIERLVTEAVIRFDPDRAEAERQKAADQRHFDIGDPNTDGQVWIDGLLDVADGRDLDQAIAREAHTLGQLGDDSSLDVRRSKAAGAIARRDLMLDLDTEEGEEPEQVPPPVEEVAQRPSRDPGRKVTLSVHITDTTLTGENPVGRCEETRSPVSAEQIKEWLQAPGTHITVQPVIDLADCIPVTAYEIPGRHRRRVELRDHTCRFPHCTRPAKRCDLDHAVEHNRGGPTCPCNLVPLCRRHHRAKTHGRWRYEVLSPGRYEWTSPNGLTFTVTPDS
jgi:hypothetical protein